MFDYTWEFVILKNNIYDYVAQILYFIAQKEEVKD